MNKKQFQEKYKLTDQEMAKLEFILKEFKGKILEIKDLQLKRKRGLKN